MVPGQHPVRMNMYITRSENGTFKVVKTSATLIPAECEVPLLTGPDGGRSTLAAAAPVPALRCPGVKVGTLGEVVVDKMANLELAIGELHREVEALDDSEAWTSSPLPAPWTVRRLASHALRRSSTVGRARDRRGDCDRRGHHGRRRLRRRPRWCTKR